MLFITQLVKTEEGQRPAWLRPIIVIAVLFLSVALSVLGKPKISLLAGAAIFGIPVVFAFLRWPQVGLAALVVASFLIPSPFGPGSAGAVMHSAILLTVLLTLLWMLDMVVREKRISINASITNSPLIALMIVAIIALINGQINYYYLARLASPIAQISGLAVFLLSIAAYFLGANQIKTQAWLEKLTWLFLAIGAIYMIGRLTPLTERFIRPIFQYGSDASLFWTWMVALGASQGLINTRLDKRWRVALGLLTATTIYVALI